MVQRYKLLLTFPIVLYYSSSAFSLPPFHFYRDTWYASQEAMARGYPETIEIEGFNNAKVGGSTCKWSEDEGGDFGIVTLTINCSGMKPIEIFWGEGGHEGSEGYRDTLSAYFGDREANPWCDDADCPIPYHSVYVRGFNSLVQRGG